MRPREYFQPMLDAMKISRIKNPDKYVKIAIANLPKDCKGDKNGNWKGGKTSFSRRFRSTSKYKNWRKLVLSSFKNKCADCSSKDNIEAHHIIPLSRDISFAHIKINGVALCRKCHINTDSYAINSYDGGEGKLAISIVTIPHKWQHYETLGNWGFGDNNVLLITVSNMEDIYKEYLVGRHEMDEAMLCLSRGIKDEAITKFDISHPKHEDPGWHPKAPYHKEHIFAEIGERLMASELGIDWLDYERQIQEKVWKK